MQTEKTIFALATNLGGAIAIIRISGAETLNILSSIFTGKIKDKMLAYGKIIDESGNLLDECMAVYFKSPKSYTGEDMAELHIHAGKAVCDSVMELLLKKGAVPAEAGEFSKRAFLNGKMRLSQAEAVMDLISASAKRSANAALLQLSGALSDRISEIENRLVNLVSLVNAQIDYPDEMEDEAEDITKETENVLCEIELLLNEGLRSHNIRDGFKIALVGKANVGKSSLLNALILEEKAIVTNIAGTTRDVIEADADFCGLPVHLYDTAGLHDTTDEVERIGIERTRSAISTADLLYVVIDSSSELTKDDTKLLDDTKDKQRIIVLTKCDKESAVKLPSDLTATIIHTSTKTSMGLNKLKEETAKVVCPMESSGIITNMRHIEALGQARDALLDSLKTKEPDCIVTDLSRALTQISKITGNAVDEAVLDRIFERFCVGK